jgi:hypothetical protein
MKKSLILFSSLFILLSACSRDLNTPDMMTLQPVDQVDSLAVDDNQAQNIVNSSRNELTTITETLFMQYFADGMEIPMKNTNGFINNLAEKGGMLFNILNKSKIAQSIGYALSDYPVRAKFNKHGTPDNTPRITPPEIEKLKSILKPGDLILCGNDDSFIHAILYTGNDQIIHSLATKVEGPQKFLGVVKETLTAYLTRSSRDKFVVLRYNNLVPADFQSAVEYASRQVGKGYDTLFLLNSDQRFYCTELVYQSLMHMNNPPQVFPHKEKLGWKLITNEDFMDSPDLSTVWTFNIKRPPVAQLHQYN